MKKQLNRPRIEVVNLEEGNGYGLPGQYEFLYFKKGGRR